MPSWILPQAALPIFKIKTRREKLLWRFLLKYLLFFLIGSAELGGDFLRKKPNLGNSKFEVTARSESGLLVPS